MVFFTPEDLKTLRLSASHMRSASTIRMTDITVYFAFLQLENLEKLHLDYFPVNFLSILTRQKIFIKLK